MQGNIPRPSGTPFEGGFVPPLAHASRLCHIRKGFLGVSCPHKSSKAPF
ncbi:hypothetical protein SAMN04488513_101414 [Pseudozobellia thermophila]|uniref:Uncharacterized protein n=1 Tax=Pseudozobellia thermophila TaxID=192903 RepID=A0A1M6BGP9_9FLAO|nr:hypothetical protein SAMN04488513_101414 [Pseudozobellia thermophila]